MKFLFSAALVAASLGLVIGAFAQSISAPATAVPAPANSPTVAPVPIGKRLTCQTASQTLTGQDKRDQMQLCMAQAHLDCLKQAINQKIVGPQRKDFVKSCAE